MKITSVEAIPLEAPIARPVGRARQTVPITARRALLVRIATDEGLVGYGEGLAPVAPWAAAEVVRRVLAPFLLGQDPLNSEALWELLYSTNGSRGYRSGYQMIALSAVDIALWDLKGKIMGRPVYQLLGGACREKIPVYVTGLMLEKDPALTLRLAEGFLAQGFKALKLKIGEDLAADVAMVGRLRQAVGPGIKLMVDANGGYDVKTALRAVELLAPHDVFWFEEPVTSEDPAGLAQVRRGMNMYLATGECLYTRHDFRDLLLREAVDVCQPDVSRAGGITETRRIASLAHAFHARYAPHAWGGALCIAASAHLALAMPNFLIFELDQVPNPLREELPTRPPLVEDGFLCVPDLPGLGVEIDPAALARYRKD